MLPGTSGVNTDHCNGRDTAKKLLKLESFHDTDILVVWGCMRSVSAVFITKVKYVEELSRHSIDTWYKARVEFHSLFEYL